MVESGSCRLGPLCWRKLGTMQRLIDTDIATEVDTDVKPNQQPSCPAPAMKCGWRSS
jgi:hypothetical protein